MLGFIVLSQGFFAFSRRAQLAAHPDFSILLYTTSLRRAIIKVLSGDTECPTCMQVFLLSRSSSVSTHFLSRTS